MKSNLKYDKEPLFQDRERRPRHLKERINEPRIQPVCRPVNSEQEVGATGIREEISRSDISRSKQAPLPGAGLEKGFHGKISEVGERKLRRCAAAIVHHQAKDLFPAGCRVTWSFNGLFGYVFTALKHGYSRKRILWALEKALWKLNSTADDLGQQFDISSTIFHARKFLQDGQTTGQRVQQFYEDRRKDLRDLNLQLGDARQDHAVVKTQSAPPPPNFSEELSSNLKALKEKIGKIEGNDCEILM